MHIGMLDLDFWNGSRTWSYSKLQDLCLVCANNRIGTIFFWLMCMPTPLSWLQSNPWVDFYSSRNVITFIGRLCIQENTLNLVARPHGKGKNPSDETLAHARRPGHRKSIELDRVGQNAKNPALLCQLSTSMLVFPQFLCTSNQYTYHSRNCYNPLWSY